MVVDLQGVKADGKFILTDPVVLCTDTSRFGCTNLGKGFMQKCRASAKAYLAMHFEGGAGGAAA
jgi:hypothetical protein